MTTSNQYAVWKGMREESCRLFKDGMSSRRFEISIAARDELSSLRGECCSSPETTVEEP
jgi:hypothetical protein